MADPREESRKRRRKRRPDGEAEAPRKREKHGTATTKQSDGVDWLDAGAKGDVEPERDPDDAAALLDTQSIAEDDVLSLIGSSLPINFGHYFVKRQVEDVGSAIAEAIRINDFVGGSIATGQSFERVEFVVYMCRIHWGTMFYLPGDDPWLLDLSRLLDAPIHECVVWENGWSRRYRKFVNGQIDEALFDPAGLDGKPTHSGYEFGEGPRKFPSVEAFLTQTAESYKCVDDVWSFDRWHDKTLRMKVLTEVDPLYLDSSIRMRLTRYESKIAPIGKRDPETRRTAKLLEPRVQPVETNDFRRY
ncbi:MAG: hypothetical protein AAGJ97_01350 [Planctomycetota bacterium]